MAKRSNKLTSNATKPITDFFKPKSLSQSSSLATVASNSDAPSSEPTKKFQSRVFEDTTSLRKVLRPPTKPMVQTAVSSTSSLKRSRSSDTHSRGLNHLPLRHIQKPLPETCNSPARREATFNTDSDRKQDSVAHVERIETPQSKKRRICSPGPSSLHSSSSLVPSSQSDEEELAPSRFKAQSTDVKEAVDHWRKEAFPPSPDVDNDDDLAPQMEIHPSLSSSPLTSRFVSPLTEPEHGTNLHRPKPASPFSPGFGHIPTPPYTDRHSDDATMPPTPIALDPATKAAQIIADIKARAYAATLLSPESSPSLDFKDELSDSSDDEMLPFVPVPVKGKSGTKSRVDNVDSTIMTRPTRYSLRDRTSSPAIGEGESLEQNWGVHTMPAVNLNGAHKKGKGAAKKKSAFNPLDDFLKEKRQAEKGGKGAEAFRYAESVASKQGKINLFDEMANEQAEGATFQAVKERDQWLNKPLSPDNSVTSLGAITLVEEDRQRLFGNNGGKAIIGILESDRVSKDRERAHKKFRGVPFWTTPDSAGMLVDETFPTFQIEGEDNILQLFKSALDRGDIAQASLLLDTGFLFSSKAVTQPEVTTYLCNLALSANDAPINAAAFRALLRLFSLRPNSPCGITLSSILGALHRLGAASSTMSSMGWITESSGHPPSIDTTSRESALYRLVELVASCARSQRLLVEDIPELVAALLLIATDPSTSLPLQRDITTAINQICNSIGPEAEVLPEIEVRICSKVLDCVSRCQPINKAYLLSFLAAGTGRTLRIARYAAFSIVTEQATVTPFLYSDLPPISEILDALLLTSSDQSGIFDLHAETDYVDLGFYVYILSVALSNVKGWALEERKQLRLKPNGHHSPNKLGSGEDKPKTPLQVLSQALESLHSGISDTRAAHLDRSRTKAAVKALSVRIYYQRDAWIKGNTNNTGKPRMNLRQYFPTKS